MRVDLKRFIFVGARVDQDNFFVQLQKAGLVEFINPKNIKQVKNPPEVEKFVNAIKILRSYILDKQLHKIDLDLAERMADEIVQLKNLYDQEIAEAEKIAKEIEHRSEEHTSELQSQR